MKGGENIKEFIEKAIHMKIELVPFENTNIFPLILQANYSYYYMKVLGLTCISVIPKETFNLSTLRKHQRKISQITQKHCVLYLQKMNYYTRDKMLEEGIPFIWENRQVYIPFLGFLLQQNEARILRSYSRISFLTQKLLLSALYENWDNISVTIAAEKMRVSKMSITRVFDELESLDVPVLQKNGRIRKYVKIGTKKEIWAVIKPVLRSPLLKEYYLEQDFSHKLVKSGISALAELSMLGDSEYPTYAITKHEIREKGLDKVEEIPKGEIPGCIVQELGYCIPFKNETTIDPLTIYLMLKNEDDPRIQTALEEMLEDYVW